MTFVIKGHESELSVLVASTANKQLLGPNFVLPHNKIFRFYKMINFQILGHFLMGYRNKTNCIASCNLHGDELPKSFDEIHFIRDVITSIQSENCAQEWASSSVLKVGGFFTAMAVQMPKSVSRISEWQ